jgi:hypothetical protein
MSKNSNSSANDHTDPVWSIAKILAPYLKQLLPGPGSSPITYYHQHNSPLGKRVHLDLVRRGVLRGHKVARKVLVLCEDLHRYIDSQKPEPPPPEPPSPEPPAEDPLSDWDLKRKGRP